MSEAATVEKDEGGIRLDRWFKRHYLTLGHGPLSKLLRTGQVRVDGKRADPGLRLEVGQIIRIPPQLQGKGGTEQERDVRAVTLKDSDKKLIQQIVIHEDSALIVLNKPSGLATQGGSGVTRHVDGMLEELQGKRRQRPRLVHRLDRDTSGVLLVARTVPAAAALSESLRQRDAQKIYWALVKGVPRPPQGTIKLALAKEGDYERMEVSDGEDAKEAVTHYTVVEKAGEAYAWVALKPVTGRTHQLRAHMGAIGTPIVGDFKYGGERAKGSGEVEDRLHLHARSLNIAHPDGGRLSISAPLPPHMTKTWNLFGFDRDDKKDHFVALSGTKPPGTKPPGTKPPGTKPSGTKLSGTKPSGTKSAGPKRRP